MTLVYTKLHFDPLLFENILGKLSYKIFTIKNTTKFWIKVGFINNPFLFFVRLTSRDTLNQR